MEVVRQELVEVLEEGVLEDLRVQLRHAVHAGGPDDGEVGHAHVALAALVDEAHARKTFLVAGEQRGDLAQETSVDLVDDLEVAREEALHHRNGPLLKRLGEDRVVRVAGRAARDVPGLVPLHALLVHEHAHELGDDERGMRLVQVDEGLVRQLRPVGGAVVLHEAAQDVRERAAREEVLLAEAQLLAGHRVVVRVEHLREVLGEHLRLDRLHVGSLVEVREVELVHRLRAPETERVDGVGVADDGEVVGDALHLLGALPHPLRLPAVLHVLHAAAELDDLRVLGTRELPRIAVLEPVVRLLDLLAVHDALAEDAVVVPEAVAHAGEVEGGHRVEEARRKPSEAAVTKAGVHLEVAQRIPVDVVFLQRLRALAVELEVDHVVAEQTPDEELERKVVDAPLVLPVVALLRLHPPLDEPVANRVGERRVLVAGRCLAVIFCERIAQMPCKVLFQTLHAVDDPSVASLAVLHLHHPSNP